MRAATAEQIEQWTHDVVELARTLLPSDHPRYHRIGGSYLAEVRKRAHRAEDYLSARGIMPARAEIENLANGGVDIEAFRAHRALVTEVYAMRLTLDWAHKLDLLNLTCLAEALRPVVDRMRAALPEMEKKA